MDPIALDAYEQLAEGYAAQAGTKLLHNAYIDRPATFSLLPDVRGKRILDVGCGPGLYTEIFLDRGAEVVGIDVSPTMVRLARERVGERAQVYEADFGKPLACLGDQTFDIVVSPLALDHVEDLRPSFKEFHRVLKNSGLLVFSLDHPFSDYLLCKNHGQSENYFAIELARFEWTGLGKPVTVPWYRRPLAEIVNPVIESGFVLERILEAVPTREFCEAAPEEYERHSREPTLMHIRARKM